MTQAPTAAKAPIELQQAHDPQDDWSGLASAKERRKLQNRLNQRAYREYSMMRVACRGMTVTNPWQVRGRSKPQHRTQAQRKQIPTLGSRSGRSAPQMINRNRLNKKHHQQHCHYLSRLNASLPQPALPHHNHLHHHQYALHHHHQNPQPPSPPDPPPLSRPAQQRHRPPLAPPIAGTANPSAAESAPCRPRKYAP